ncbi:MAG TPA: PEPxxWA-CTERM sorting domain-containing protein [Thiobacillus sp.]|nr:PEPxxWA-CTERM sorting domain-containing protein [Thiobacillus sp.]HQT71299.1 PEPxxWA-CTERM sorting domain-containing protein [Thiobacillus sp.]
MFKAINQRAVASALFTVGMTLSSAVFAVSASTTYSFVGVTSTNAANVATGVAALSMEVIDLGGSQVAFKFTNNSISSVADVYFDDGTLLGIASISDSGTGVAFTQYATPADLPGGNNLTPTFSTTAGFSADSDAPVSFNGVTSGEWLTITFNLQAAQTYASVISALSLPNYGGIGDLRVGLHVQSFADGGSESFVNVPAPVPEPETYAMLLAGLGLVGFAARRKLS